MIEDLSGMALARQRLHQTERLETVGRLAGGVAHDFNNLLTGVLLYCDLLMSVVGPADRARKYAEEIRKAGLQASGLVRQLLSVIRSNKSLPRPISLNEVAEGMRNLLVRLIGENIELKLRLDPALGLVKMDPVQAQQILLNLVLNARDALPEGGIFRLKPATARCRFSPPTKRAAPKRRACHARFSPSKITAWGWMSRSARIYSSPSSRPKSAKGRALDWRRCTTSLVPLAA
jgi:nitrogen-specific signal transduction histidine kinase